MAKKLSDDKKRWLMTKAAQTVTRGGGTLSGLGQQVKTAKANGQSKTTTKPQNTVTASRSAAGTAFDRLTSAAKTLGDSARQIGDSAVLRVNSKAWHTAGPTRRNELKAANDAIRRRNGWSYDRRTGETYTADTRGPVMRRQPVAPFRPTDMRDRRAVWAREKEAMRDVSGMASHRTMASLYDRAEDTWSKAENALKRQTEQSLADEMARIASRYGLKYSGSGLGASDSWGMPDTVSDRTAVQRLRQMGADENTLRYVQENIALRAGADRWRQGMEAVGKRAAGSIPALVETAQQQAENVETSRKSPAYAALEQEIAQLENVLASTLAVDAMGQVSPAYTRMYAELEEKRERLHQMGTHTAVDQNLTGQRMMREAAEAQRNATAGMAAAPRFLANSAISIAGNAPVMATAAIPGAGTALASVLMGTQAAGQKAAELNARGIDPGEALTRGAAAGVIEAVTEKLPIDRLADLLKTGGKGAVKNILRQMGVEAGEESASYVMNYAADYAAANPEARFSFAELAEAALGGAVSGGVFGAAGTAAGGQRTTAIDTNPETHTPEQMEKINEYVNAVDEGLLEFVQQTMEGQDGEAYCLKDVSQRAAQDIKAVIGIDATGYQTKLEPRMVRHIIQRHGANGAADRSMANMNDIARIQYVLDQYDDIRDGGSSGAYKEPKPDLPGRNRNAKTVVYGKKINGSYYVVEAVPVSNKKTAFITSAYIQKGDQPILDAQDSAPGVTSNNVSLNLLNQSIPQTEGNSNHLVNKKDLMPTTAIRRSTTDGHIAMQSGLSTDSIEPDGGNVNPTRDAAALTRRMVELDEELRQADTLLPGAGKDRLIARLRAEMEETARQLADGGAETSTQPTGGNTADLTPQEIAQAAMQFGKTPEQGVMEAREKKAGELRRAAKYAYRNIVSGQAEIEQFAKAQEKVFAKTAQKGAPAAATANDLMQINRAAGSTVDTIAETALVDRAGNRMGAGWLETVGGLTEEQLEELNLYRLHQHNIDRMSLVERSQGERTEAAADYNAFLNENPAFKTMTEASIKDWQRNGTFGEKALAEEYLALKNRLDRLQKIENKPVLAKVDDEGKKDVPYTAKDSERIIRQMEENNPQLAEWAKKAEDFHDAFMREWAVGSGLMSEEQFDRLRERYPHYVQTFRKRDNWGDAADVTRHGGVNTGSPIREAVGDLSEIVPFEDAEMMQVNALVKNARRNELFCNIYDFAKNHPQESAPFVRILGEDADWQAPDSVDDMNEMLDAHAMSEQGGVYTIRAMVEGTPIQMQVNADFYAGLQNLFGQDKGASDTFMKKVFGTATNAFKQLTTGRNPMFFLTNLPKDFQTAYINTTSDRKLLLTYLADVAGTVQHMATDAADWQAFQALGGKNSGFYHNEKGFTQSAKDASKHKGLKKAFGAVDAISENTEALWRFNEYRAALRKYGDTAAGRAKAMQAAADVTTNFARSAPATKAAENYCAYLNASVQGLDKLARQLKSHPFTTTRRAAEMIALPTLILWMINRDDENYRDLNDRTKDNYFCIPVGGGKFLKIPKSREYGVAMGALLERFFRLGEGEAAETAFRGIGEQFMTNLAPSNPVTDNILKTVFIDLPTNRDFAGRSIVPERMLGLSPENQYDYSTSGAGMALAKGWNATLGRAFGKVSPIQMDYLLDANLGFVGDAIIGATTNPKSPAELAKDLQEHPAKTALLPVFNTLERKFIADPLYQSGVTDSFYHELEQAEAAKNDRNFTEGLAAEVVTPEEKYYSELSRYSAEIGELRKAERALLADRSLTDEYREEQIMALRRRMNEIAKTAPDKAREAREEYEKTYVPELSHLSEEKQAIGREGITLGIPAEVFAETERALGDIEKSDTESARVRRRKYLMERSDLTDEQKTWLDYNLIDGKHHTDYSDTNYMAAVTWTNPQTGKGLTDARIEQAMEAAGSGMTVQAYCDAYAALGSMESTRDANGESMGDVSYKKAAWINANVQDEAARSFLYDAFDVAQKARSAGISGAGAVNPVEGGTLSSVFGPRQSPTRGASSWHKAIDIAADAGTPVRSTLPGKVVAVNPSGYGGGYGVSVRIEHADGIVTEYHHMQEGSADNIHVGDEVAAGQQIGAVGSTGISTGPHLDMQAWKDGQIVDPLTIIPGYGVPSGYTYDGSVSSGVIASGAAAGKKSGGGKNGSRGSNGLKSLKGLKRLPTF